MQTRQNGLFLLRQISPLDPNLYWRARVPSPNLLISLGDFPSLTLGGFYVIQRDQNRRKHHHFAICKTSSFTHHGTAAYSLVSDALNSKGCDAGYNLPYGLVVPKSTVTFFSPFSSIVSLMCLAACHSWGFGKYSGSRWCSSEGTCTQVPFLSLKDSG